MNFSLRKLYWIVALLPLLLLVALFLNNGPYRYGDNGDNYRMLNSWQVMIANGLYTPSRFQGNIPSELAMGYLASVFGPLGPNGLSLVLSLCSLVLAALIFLRIERSYIRVALVVATICANPYWTLAATTSMDYNHPLPFFLGGIFLLLSGSPAGAALALAVTAGIRISYLPMGAAAIIWPWVFGLNRKKLYAYLEPLAVFFSVTALIYLPVFISSHLSFSFLASARPVEQGFVGVVARFFYKSLYLYGIPGTLTVVIALILSRKQISLPQPGLAERQVLLWACYAAILFSFILFLYIPGRIQYLMPVLFAVAGLLLLARPRLWLMSLIVIAELSYWFINIDLLDIKYRSPDPCEAIVAIDAKFAPHIARGVTVGEITGDTNEIRCLPSLLMKAPANIGDRLPAP